MIQIKKNLFFIMIIWNILQGKSVNVKPEVVVEINYEEIQKSPTYNSGYALRFPRVVNLRLERSAEECSTLKMVEEFYEGQRHRK